MPGRQLVHLEQVLDQLRLHLRVALDHGDAPSRDRARASPLARMLSQPRIAFIGVRSSWLRSRGTRPSAALTLGLVARLALAASSRSRSCSARRSALTSRLMPTIRSTVPSSRAHAPALGDPDHAAVGTHRAILALVDAPCSSAVAIAAVDTRLVLGMHGARRCRSSAPNAPVGKPEQRLGIGGPRHPARRRRSHSHAAICATSIAMPQALLVLAHAAMRHASAPRCARATRSSSSWLACCERLLRRSRSTTSRLQRLVQLRQRARLAEQLDEHRRPSSAGSRR